MPKYYLDKEENTRTWWGVISHRVIVCCIAVKQMPHEKEFVGSIPARCRALFFYFHFLSFVSGLCFIKSL